MSRHVAVMMWGTDNRVGKSLIFDSKAEADAHIANFSERFPDAFSHRVLKGDVVDWVVDPATETLTYSEKPTKPKPVITLDEFEDRFTAAEWDKATDYIYEVDTSTGKPKRRALIQGLSRATRINLIDLSGAKTAAFMGKLVSGGVITASRKAAILDTAP